ncbi:hypothetical protein WN943_028878 [Citrus x changshan-huyou]
MLDVCNLFFAFWFFSRFEACANLGSCESGGGAQLICFETSSQTIIIADLRIQTKNEGEIEQRKKSSYSLEKQFPSSPACSQLFLSPGRSSQAQHPAGSQLVTRVASTNTR